MMWLSFLDIAPDPTGIGIIAVVLLFVIGIVVLLGAALVAFLWYRKRSTRYLEVGPVEPDDGPH